MILTNIHFILNSCGQVGHLAENCSSTERLCFNCGKGGHESSACPDPRTTDQKSCYHCLSKGHIKADCPNIGSRPISNVQAVAATGAATTPGATAGNGAATGCFVSMTV